MAITIIDFNILNVHVRRTKNIEGIFLGVEGKDVFREGKIRSVTLLENLVLFFLDSFHVKADVIHMGQKIDKDVVNFHLALIDIHVFMGHKV